MPKPEVSQLRYTNEEVDGIKALFPDVDSLKLYRKYLLDLPITKDEKARIKAQWAHKNVRHLIQKVTLPVITGDEAIGVGYDLLNNIKIDELVWENQERRVELFVEAIEYLKHRIEGLDHLAESCTGAGRWLTAAVTDSDEEITTMFVMTQLVIKQNVEGILVGLNALVQMKAETKEERDARLKANSTR